MGLRSHNKKRNSALLYEFLIKYISKSLVEQKKDQANKALEITKKFFSKGKPLSEELNLFNTIIKTRVKSRDSAQKILDAVVAKATTQNARVLDAQKSKLIKELNYNLDRTALYSYRVPNYTILASIHTLITEGRKKNPGIDVVNAVKLEDKICEYLVRGPDASLKKIKTNPEYSNAVFQTVVKKFNEKYQGKLSEAQRGLLTQYAIYLLSDKKQPLKDAILGEIDVIKRKLNLIQDAEIKKDLNLMKKLNECYKKIVSVDFETITEENMLDVLRYVNLVEELES